MAKNEDHATVVWQLSGDALAPKPAPWGFVVQNPVQKVLAPNQEVRIDTGVAANVPLLTIMRSNSEHISVPQIIPAGTNLVVVVTNRGQTPLVVDDKESLVNIYPLSFSGTAVVG